MEKSSIFPEFASTASEKSEERTPQAREHVSGVHCFLQLSHPSPCKSHQQVNWRPCHSIFLIHYTSNHLLLHLSQMKLNEINCWRVWIWRAHTSCASGKLPYTDLSSDVCWSCDITKQVTFFLLLQLEHKQSCPRVAECGILQLRHTSTWQFKGHERDQKRDESILSTFCCKQTNWCLKHAK